MTVPASVGRAVERLGAVPVETDRQAAAVGTGVVGGKSRRSGIGSLWTPRPRSRPAARVYSTGLSEPRIRALQVVLIELPQLHGKTEY